MPRCCVVLPTYCEAHHLPTLVPAIFAQQARILSHELWLVVVNDEGPGGGDDSAALLEGLQREFPRMQVVRGRKQGLGVAYQRGFAQALATLAPSLLVQMDGDWQHDPAMLPALIEACGPAVAAVVGSRFAPGGATPAFSWRRRATSRVGNWLIHRLAGLPHLYDYTSGFRCLDAAALARCLQGCRVDKLATRGYAFQSSLITELLLSGAPVVELPIRFGQRQYGNSKLGGRDYLEFALNLRRLRARCRRRTDRAARAGA
ncbi:MAG TPA: glycosyltransferase [Terriglobales bacterium]|nr:glycosyltransferase [Terriglobales bacterium]